MVNSRSHSKKWDGGASPVLNEFELSGYGLICSGCCELLKTSSTSCWPLKYVHRRERLSHMAPIFWTLKLASRTVFFYYETLAHHWQPHQTGQRILDSNKGLHLSWDWSKRSQVWGLVHVMAWHGNNHAPINHGQLLGHDQKKKKKHPIKFQEKTVTYGNWNNCFCVCLHG